MAAGTEGGSAGIASSQMSRHSPAPSRDLHVPRVVQPDDTTCGPACLAQVAACFGRDMSVPDLVEGLSRLHHGGTLGVFLALRAMGQSSTSTASRVRSPIRMA